MSFVKFLNCKIDLRNKIFIPRPETEFWVGKAIGELKIVNCELKILDIFSGSGCIGIAILKNIKNCRMDFVDVDERAIKQIKINLKLNKIPENRYRIFQSDLFDRIKGNYDFIFANPPYVAQERTREVQPSVLKYEPKIALFGGKKGLFFIKKFLKEAKRYLKKQGIIFMEFDPLQKEDIKSTLIKEKYQKFEFRKDQFKKYRWIKIFY